MLTLLKILKFLIIYVIYAQKQMNFSQLLKITIKQESLIMICTDYMIMLLKKEKSFMRSMKEYLIPSIKDLKP